MLLHPPRLLKSFQHAFQGLGMIFQEERNFRIHVICSLAVFALSALFRIHWYEFLLIFISVILLLILEIINTVFERFQDLVKPRVHHYVAFIKDVMAGAVVLAALNASVVSGVILFQRAYRWFFLGKW